MRATTDEFNPAQSLNDLQSIELVPRSRSKTMATQPTLVSNEVRGTGRQVRRERCMSIPMQSTNVTIWIDVHPPNGITTAPGIQVETGAIPKCQASVQASSLYSQVSSLQPAQGSRHHPREKIRSKSLDQRLFVTKTVSQQKCQHGVESRPRTSLPTF